jgi:hypothetical protein
VKRRRLKKHALTPALILILLCVSSSSSLSDDRDIDIINKFISKQESQESGNEYRDARRVIARDLNRDGISDLAVLYTIEGQNGTNNYVQYLAFFIRVNGRLVYVTHTAVGGRLYRDVETESIKDNVIFLKTLNYTAKDAACCPSKEGMAQYALVRHRLKEL